MALKPTIYKFQVSISDLDKEYFAQHVLTIAQHPSESVMRMQARFLAFCFEASERLSFTRGLSTPDEPDICLKSLDDQLLEWVEVGEPSSERIKKASRRSQAVSIYSFNSKSEVWWRQESANISALPVSVYRLVGDGLTALVENTARTMDMSVTISAGAAFIASDKFNLEIQRDTLQALV